MYQTRVKRPGMDEQFIKQCWTNLFRSIPYSLFPIPYSLFSTPYSLFPSLRTIPHNLSPPYISYREFFPQKIYISTNFFFKINYLFTNLLFWKSFYNNKNDLWTSVFNATDPILADNIICDKMPLNGMVEPFFNFHFWFWRRFWRLILFLLVKH